MSSSQEHEKLWILSEQLWTAVHEENQRKNQKMLSTQNGGMNRTTDSRTYLLSDGLHADCVRPAWSSGTARIPTMAVRIVVIAVPEETVSA
jgi:hypothetical protein